MDEPFARDYSRRERRWLWLLALFGFVGVNGAFLYGIFFRPGAMAGALSNPVSVAFMVEAGVMVGVLAYLLTRWRMTRLHWAWFVILSLAGGLAFALPVALLWPPRRDR